MDPGDNSLTLDVKHKRKAPLGNSPSSPAQHLCKYHCTELGNPGHLRAAELEEGKVYSATKNRGIVKALISFSSCNHLHKLCFAKEFFLAVRRVREKEKGLGNTNPKNSKEN